ncbi:MAG: AI-2E family transporter [Planctomycetes bacterium]|nr:AI-2E family transporter [Planctomycetota bacterium]
MTHEHREETNWVMTVSLVILAVVALAAALIYTRAIMIPFVVALFIVALVSPIQDFQVKWLRFPRVISLLTTLLIVLILIALVSLGLAQVGRTIAYTATDYAKSFDKMADRVFEEIDRLLTYLEPEKPQVPPVAAPNEPASPAAPNEPKPVEKEPQPEAFALFPLIKDTAQPAVVDVVPWSAPPKEPNDPSEIEDAILEVSLDAPLRVQWQSVAKQMVRDTRNYIFNILTTAVGTIFGMISSIFFVVIFVLFMLLGRNPRAEHSQVYTDIAQKIRRYMGIKIAVSAVTGVLVWATLNIIGLKLASMFGVLAFLLNFIPSIGSVIATLLPIPIAVVQFGKEYTPPGQDFNPSPEFTLPVILVVAIPGLIQNILGNLIEPKLQGEGLNLHPVTILLALSFWGLLWGIVGMFLAAPITAAIRIVLMQFDTFRPLTDLMAGDFSRPQTAAAVAATPAAIRPEEPAPAGSPPE